MRVWSWLLWCADVGLRHADIQPHFCFLVIWLMCCLAEVKLPYSEAETKVFFTPVFTLLKYSRVFLIWVSTNDSWWVGTGLCTRFMVREKWRLTSTKIVTELILSLHPHPPAPCPRASHTWRRFSCTWTHEQWREADRPSESRFVYFRTSVAGV